MVKLWWTTPHTHAWQKVGIQVTVFVNMYNNLNSLAPSTARGRERESLKYYYSSKWFANGGLLLLLLMLGAMISEWQLSCSHSSHPVEGCRHSCIRNSRRTSASRTCFYTFQKTIGTVAWGEVFSEPSFCRNRFFAFQIQSSTLLSWWPCYPLGRTYRSSTGRFLCRFDSRVSRFWCSLAWRRPWHDSAFGPNLSFWGACARRRCFTPVRNRALGGLYWMHWKRTARAGRSQSSMFSTSSYSRCCLSTGTTAWRRPWWVYGDRTRLRTSYSWGRPKPHFFCFNSLSLQYAKPVFRCFCLRLSDVQQNKF